MIDISQLAQQAMAVLAPLLPVAATAAGNHLADGFLSQPGAKLFDWLTTHMKGKPAQVTLDRAIAEPQNERRLEALRLEVEELAEKDEEFRERLSKLVQEAIRIDRDSAITQTANPVGDNNKIGQGLVRT